MGLFYKIQDMFSENTEKVTTQNELTLLNLTVPQTKTSAAYIDEWQIKSDELYVEFIKNIKKFNPFEIDATIKENIPLGSIELNFLKYVNGKNIQNPQIAQYWIYDYNIDFCYIMSRFFNEGYLSISSGADTLSFLKVYELKSMLKQNNLKVSGKKADLITRINDNLSIEEINTLVPNEEKRYVLTEKGINATKGIQPSATKNLELENKCIDYILNKDFNSAYKAICSWEATHKYPRGLNINWNIRAKQGLASYELNLYMEYMLGIGEKPDYILSIEKTFNDNLNIFKATVILGNMLGVEYKKIKDLYLRVAPNENIEQSTLEGAIKTSSAYIQNLNQLKQATNSIKYKNTNNKYKFSAALDLETCEICGKLDGKVFKYKDAIPGVNFPPMHAGCRCCIIPYNDNKYFKEGGKRAARDPETGRSILVDDMSYEEWKEKYIEKK